uniref:At3g05675-like ankyrin-like domain-containing protein n=1 Tax=Ananas comosus var. bracteatus TaxID=296719 RepID=A0A6V7NV32_ANACO|nr:unnamed protein product [Ananas comosus var. bracteatus]
MFKGTIQIRRFLVLWTIDSAIGLALRTRLYKTDFYKWSLPNLAFSESFPLAEHGGIAQVDERFYCYWGAPDGWMKFLRSEFNVRDTAIWLVACCNLCYDNLMLLSVDGGGYNFQAQKWQERPGISFLGGWRFEPAKVLLCVSISSLPLPCPGGFNDPATADVLLRLLLDPEPDSFSGDGGGGDSALSLDLHLHSAALRRSRYFDALLSGRWAASPSDHLTYRVSSSAAAAAVRRRRRPFDAYVAVLRLLHTLDFSGGIPSASDAIEMLRVSLELVCDECARACVRFLEAVPWTEEEEDEVLSIAPFLPSDDSRDLLARISSPAGHRCSAASEDMLRGLISSAIHSHPSVATIKAFVAKLLREHSSRDSVRRVLDGAFLASLDTVKELMGKYASPDLRVSGDNDEREAIQRLNLHAAVVNTKHLYWLIERMIELRLADSAVDEWADQVALAADLQKTLRDDAWKNIAPGLPLLVTRCTFRLANAVASGSTLAPRQVRMKLVKSWLPVLNVCRDIIPPIPSGHKSVFQELEETFLQIISTLPVSDAQELLQQCLTFSTRNIDDCQHLIAAFKTWFRRADRTPPELNDSK